MAERIAYDPDLAMVSGRLDMKDPRDQQRWRMVQEDAQRWREADHIARHNGMLLHDMGQVWERLELAKAPAGLDPDEWREDMERRIVRLYEKEG